MIEESKMGSHDSTSDEESCEDGFEEENHDGGGLERMPWPLEMRAVVE